MKAMLIIKLAYGLIILAVLVKSYGLIILAGKKDKPFQERKKTYSRFNWSGNIMLAIGVVILALKWYF